jgi:hypothetical protein
MKSKRFLLGLLAITLVFGMMVTGCGDKDTSDVAKKLTITGIPSTVKTPYVEVYLVGTDFVAGGYATTSSTVTIDLKQVTITTGTGGIKIVSLTKEDWKGTGKYSIFLFESTGEGGKFSEMTAYGIDKEIKNETTTIAFSDFDKIIWPSGSINFSIGVR